MPDDKFSMQVYFLLSPNTGYVKIGKSAHYADRYKTLCGQEQAQLEELLLVYAEDTETQLHHYFSESRIRKTEWFLLDDRLTALITASKDADHLVYPEGIPYKELPVDSKRELKYQSKKISALDIKLERTTSLLQGVRQKRDEYKSLAGSAKYYRDIVEGNRREDREKNIRSYVTSSIILTVCVSLIFIPGFIFNPVSVQMARASLLFTLVSYAAASNHFYKQMRYTKGTKNIQKFSRVVWLGFSSGFVVMVLTVLTLFISGV